jgi:hypothetical protein
MNKSSRTFRYHGQDWRVTRNFGGSTCPTSVPEGASWGALFECLSNQKNGPLFGPFFGKIPGFDLASLSENELCKSLDAAIQWQPEVREKFRKRT